MKVGYAGEDEQGAYKIVTNLNQSGANEYLYSNGEGITAMVEKHAQRRRVSSTTRLFAIHLVKHAAPKITPSL